MKRENERFFLIYGDRNGPVSRLGLRSGLSLLTARQLATIWVGKLLLLASLLYVLYT